MEDLRQSLQPLYLGAVYEVDLPGGRIAFRIGGAIPQLAGQAFALITAYNPGARRPSPAECGARTPPGGGGLQGPPRPWARRIRRHVEPSFAVFGVSLGSALTIAREFDQAAIAWFDGSVAKLEWAGEADGRAAP